MKDIIEKLKRNDYPIVDLNGNKYYVQIYIDKAQGNIKRSDETVLTRFYIDKDQIKFAFQKKESPYEFDYTNYPVSVESDLEMVRMIPDSHADELYLVLKEIKEKSDVVLSDKEDK